MSCATCGSVTPVDVFHCVSCPPETCPTCGAFDQPLTDPCACWVSVEGLSLADRKAIFAADGTFNVEVDGRITLVGGIES